MKKQLSESKFINYSKSLIQKEGTKSLISSLISILAGLFVGLVVMFILALINPDLSIGNVFQALGLLIAGPFTGSHISNNFGDMIFFATPLILCGVSVAIAFKTGLFNIGAPGQFFMGTLVSLCIALNINNSDKPVSGFFVWLIAVICGMIAGALWGSIPGLFKALLGVNEVIVCIMTNWISANIVSWVFSVQKHLHASGKGGYLITTAATGNSTPKVGLNKIFTGSYIDLGIIIVVAIAILMYIVINKTVFGYELKACGFNKDASKYCGMNEKRNIILSMAIAGALAGLGGALYYLNPGIEFNFNSAYMKLPDIGFNGIPAALLASSNPVAVIFSSIFIRYIAQGGDHLVSAGFNRYVADIIIALIIYFAGFSKLIKTFIQKRKSKKEGK